MEQLDRDEIVQVAMPGKDDLAHPAPSERAHELVFRVELTAERSLVAQALERLLVLIVERRRPAHALLRPGSAHGERGFDVRGEGVPEPGRGSPVLDRMRAGRRGREQDEDAADERGIYSPGDA